MRTGIDLIERNRHLKTMLRVCDVEDRFGVKPSGNPTKKEKKRHQKTVGIGEEQIVQICFTRMYYIVRALASSVHTHKLPRARRVLTVILDEARSHTVQFELRLSIQWLYKPASVIHVMLATRTLVIDKSSPSGKHLQTIFMFRLYTHKSCLHWRITGLL